MQQYYLSIGGPCLKNTPKSKISPSDVSRQLGQAKNLLTLKQIADTISAGYSFCPATFRDGVRNNDNVEQMQLFALDFDGDKKNDTGCVLPYEEALKRAERCHLPVVMSYETKSSVNWSSYRLIFLYNSPIYEVRLMKLINYLLYYIFPESDKKCKDLARMFYPGKEIIIHNEEYFYLDELLISAQIMADLKGKNTWKTYLNNIQKETQIITIKNSILIGFSSLEYQEFSPIPIYINMDLDQNPNNLDKISIYRLDKGLFNAPCYCGDRKIGYIFFSDKKDNPVSLDPPKIKNSELYLKHTNQKIQSERCRLYSEFISGERKLGHEEWFGLCTNMVYLNNGQTEFMNTIRGFPDLYNDPERKYHQMKYIQSEALCINRHESRYIADMFCDDNAEGCIAGVLRADTYYYDAIENTLNFLVINKLPDTYKRCIMLSATADKYIHSILFPQCRFIDLPEAMYCGKVIQDHSQSFSRNFFDKDPARILKRISDSHPDCNYITFKKFISFIDVPNERKLYFGKALGINSFSGQDLVVIGTPHCPEFVYHLVAQALGKNVSGDSLAQRTIIRNGYEFHMMTFRDKFMQRIQTYFIESELEQAVGRARLLSNDCTVYVYSRYPVKQCILAEDLRQPE